MLYQKSASASGLYNPNVAGLDREILEVITVYDPVKYFFGDTLTRRLLKLKILLGYVKQESIAVMSACSLDRFHATLNDGRQLHNYNLPYTYILNTDKYLNPIFQHVYFEKIDRAQFQKKALSGFPMEGWHPFGLKTAALTYLLQKANIPFDTVYHEALAILIGWIETDIALLEARIREIEKEKLQLEAEKRAEEINRQHKIDEFFMTCSADMTSDFSISKNKKPSQWTLFNFPLQSAIEQVLKGGKARSKGSSGRELLLDPSRGRLFIGYPYPLIVELSSEQWRKELQQSNQWALDCVRPVS